MADNTELNPGTGGDTIATDDIGGVKYQRVKLGYGVDGEYIPLSETNPLPASDGFLSAIRISSGNLAGYSALQKFGQNPDVDTGTTEDIWDLGGFYDWQTSASQVEILSDSGIDAGAGDGARTVRVFGLNSAYEPIQEDFTLNGITPVGGAQSFYRINRVKVLTVGTGLFDGNVGTLTIRDIGGGTARAGVLPTHNQSQMACYTIPAGKTGYCFKCVTSGSDNGSKGFYEFDMRVRPFNEVFRVVYTIAQAADGSTAFTRQFCVPLVFTEKSDIVFRGYSSINNSIMTAAFDMILVDN